MGVETVTTVTVNNNCQTYLPRNRFSRCSAFCFKSLFCVLYLGSADTPHALPTIAATAATVATTAAAPPTRILSRYLRKVLQGTECKGLGGVSERGGWDGRRERGGKGEKEGGRDYLGPSSVVQLPSSSSCPSHIPEGPGRRPLASQPCNLFITLIC